MTYRLLPLAALAAILFTAAPATAGQCPGDMGKIDKALAAGTQISAAQMTTVKELRAQGETQHKSGQHAASVATLKKAMDILGVK